MGYRAHLDAVLGAHASRRRQRPVPHRETVWKARHEQVRVAGAQLDRTEEAVLGDAEEVLEVRLLCGWARVLVLGSWVGNRVTHGLGQLIVAQTLM